VAPDVVASHRSHERTDRSPASFDHADPHLVEVLAELEDAQNYAEWIVASVRPHVRGRILEVGAGQGTYSAVFADMGTLTAIEPSEAQSAALRERLLDHPTAQVWATGIEDLPEHEPFDSIVLLNVLEHIPDDRGALVTLHDALAEGGRLVLWVPAFELLYGDFDHRIGHYRRYRIGELRQRCTDAGLRIVDARYTNAPGFFAWLLVVRVLGLQPTSGHLATLYDRWIVPLTRRVESWVRPPFGQSLLIVAERPA